MLQTQPKLELQAQLVLVPCNEREAAAARRKANLGQRLAECIAATECSPSEAEAILARYVANGGRF